MLEKNKRTKTPKPRYNTMQNVWFMVKLAWTQKEKKVLILSLLFALCTVAQNLVNLYVSPTILSVVERHASFTELLGTILGFTLAMILLAAALAYINCNILFGKVTLRSYLLYQIALKSATTSYSNLDNEDFQKLSKKARQGCNDNNAATEAIWETLTALTTNLLGFFIYLFLLGSIQPFFIFLILLTTVISYLLGHYANNYRYQNRDEEAGYSRQLYYLEERAKDIQTAKDIRIFGLRPWLNELYNKTFDAYSAFENRVQNVYIWAKITDLILTFLRNAIAYAVLVGLVLQNRLDVTGFLLYFSAVSGFAEWITEILNQYHILHRQSLDICTIREALDYEEPFLFETGQHLQPEAEKSYEIRLENVSFRYPNADADTLTNINLTLHPGEKLAVVGLNGAGKTTLIKLLCGFLDPTEGSVLLNGTDIRSFNRKDYYKLFSAVFQNFTLLPATIAANVAQTDEDIDMARVKKCIRYADLQKKIGSLPNGYETYLNREVYEDAILLSGGETQRLMLARALYKNAPIIILDEPTAALDPIAESDMYQKYNEMTTGKSSVYISHRLASTRFCDRIILIADGKIKEEGTHDTLLALGGSYASLYEVQSKYYKEGSESA